MKRLVFGEGLMSPSLDGSKRFTIRKYREGSHDFKKDEVVLGEFKDGLSIVLRITDDILKDSFRKLQRPKKNVNKNGYYFDKSYFNDLAAWYPDLSWDDTGAVICFEILRVEGVPVVSFNDHAPKE
ncbi:MAG: hypothetical protein HY226_00130 [Candidatus Vogelbacteria bacterium]|nr:hypothetical protein [Candidatus Vogelbacteria bacterium]